ncbi:hypothetical protein [Sphingobacterium multivorum]|uniref:Glycoside hydrolase n=1 Tax=Sphingobacterium multivorum TaxID=28454 RepID=A0A2X2JBX3_SPHMU|nr:hypothetical protein [Sphingobacterium multivorum]QRQ60223.1 hypothetical protein I6J33_19075 [Sphingobacterium multivorum]SPZ91867.1 Putative glycoside hydrolase [Sphingobacterium multivorum]
MNLKTYKAGFAAYLILVFTIFGCKKDPYKGVESNEKSIENFSMGTGFTQIGAAVVDRAAGTVKVKVLVEDNTDFSKVKPVIQQSYRATVSPASGSEVNFLAGNYKYNYTVTAETGESREWEVIVEPFTETILGTYDITGLVLYGGTGPEYGGGAVLSLTSKPWIWPVSDGPQVELDNSITFKLTGVTPTGKTTGTFVNDAGADGKYANFIYTPDPKTDVNKFYRKIPKGEGKWERDYTNDILTLIAADGSSVNCSFLGPGTEDLGNKQTKTIVNNAFAFSLNGNDDWSAIYTDYDKFVKKPRRYWVEVKKRN